VRKCVAAVVLAASCAGNPLQDQAREAFEQWRQALLAGDAERTFDMMSSGLKSQWLFDRLSAEDPEAMEFRRALAGTPRTDLDLWLEFNRKNPAPRAEVLPATVAGHASFRELYRRYFMQSLARVRQEFSTIRVSEVYPDGTGATVSVRNSQGNTEFYELVAEGDGLKINHYRGTVRHLPRQ